MKIFAKLQLKKKQRRNRQVKLSIFSVILLGTFAASILQMNLLGLGIASAFPGGSQSKHALPLQIDTVCKDCAVTPVKNETIEFTPTRIVIESAKIDLPVVSVPLKNGTWEVNNGVANFAEGTSLVSTDGGNVGIFAHDRTEGFNKIKQLQTSSSYDIVLYGKKHRAIYKTETATIVAPTAINVFYPTDESTLTLITCEGLFSEKRYMVKAKLVKIEKIK